MYIAIDKSESKKFIKFLKNNYKDMEYEIANKDDLLVDSENKYYFKLNISISQIQFIEDVENVFESLAIKF